jgi:Fis family transcriptional regulator
MRCWRCAHDTSADGHGSGAVLSRKQIEECVRASLEQYFKDLRGAEPHSLHDMVMNTVEKPLLDVVMRQAEGNQSKAAQWLGVNRNTLRRKLAEHKLVK